LETGSRQDKNALSCRQLCSQLHIADTDKTRQFCLVRVGGACEQAIRIRPAPFPVKGRKRRTKPWRSKTHLLARAVFYVYLYSAPVGERRIAIMQFVRLCVCLSVFVPVCKHISGTAGQIFTKFCMQIPCGRGSVLIWCRCDMLRTPGFMNDVTFGRSALYGVWRCVASGVALPGQSLMSMNTFVFRAYVLFCFLVTPPR